MTYHASVFPMKLALRQRCEENIGDGSDDHETGDVKAPVAAAVGAVGNDEHEYKSDSVRGYCHKIGAGCALISQVLNNGGKEARYRCEASGGCQVDGRLHVKPPVGDSHANVLPLNGSVFVK